MCCALLQVLRQTQGLKESLSASHSQAASLAAEVEQLRAELEQCQQKAVTDQEQVSSTQQSEMATTTLAHRPPLLLNRLGWQAVTDGRGIMCGIQNPCATLSFPAAAAAVSVCVCCCRRS